MSESFSVLLILSYVSGALPWSVWLGKLFLQIDPRSQTDGNPGAANAFRVGGWPLGLSVLCLDFFKAFIPVFVAQWKLQMPGDQLFWVALMPTIGHAFSMFLGFRGGRALVTLFGVWSGITLAEVPLVMGGSATAATIFHKNDVFRALFIPTSLLVYLLIREKPTWMLALCITQILILIIKVSVPFTPAGLNSKSADKSPELKI
jgi:glycerol-3-phosphate acyltransferase PlsY